MNLANKRRIVSDLLGIGKDRIWFDEDRAEDIKSAITRDDLRVLLREGAIRVKQKVGTSRGRAKKIAKQKSKGRRKGPGSRKGVKTSRLPRKEIWKVKIRKKIKKEFPRDPLMQELHEIRARLSKKYKRAKLGLTFRIRPPTVKRIKEKTGRF